MVHGLPAILSRGEMAMFEKDSNDMINDNNHEHNATKNDIESHHNLHSRTQ